MSETRVHRMPQGSDEWHMIRLGRATSSCFDQIVTPAQRKFSKSSERYAVQLLTEWLLGEPIDVFESPWADRGKELEAEARAWYEMATGNEVETVGFIERTDLLVGASTDGLTEDAEGPGVVEIKVRKAAAHVQAVLESRQNEYAIAGAPQVQGELWVTGAAWCDTVSYNPSLKPVIRRVYPDPEWFQALEESVGVRFMKMLEEGREMLYELGAVPAGRIRPRTLATWEQDITNAYATGQIEAEQADTARQLVLDGQYALAQELIG